MKKVVFCAFGGGFAAGFSFFFCPNKRKTKQKENSPSAFFCLLQYFFPLKKKNSLRSNSFFFLTLQKAPPLHGKKKRPDLDPFVGKGRDNIAPLVGVNGKHPPQTAKRIIHPWGEHHSTEHIHLNERSNVESSVGGPAFSGGA